MEVVKVDVGDVGVGDAIELLLKPENLEQLMGGHGALCFALVREVYAEGFYSRLIKDVSGIDATTRDHIAFIVFYGERSGIMHHKADYGPKAPRHRVQGFSVSTDRDIFVPPMPDLLKVPPEFAQELAHKVRYSPSDIDSATLSYQMGYATRYLMRRYSVPESALPCLLFVDGSEPSHSITVRLSSKDPLDSLFEHALRPISDEFAELSCFWRKREIPKLIEEISRRREQLNELRADMNRYSGEIDQWRTIQELIGGSYESASVCARINHLSVAADLVRKLNAYQDRLAEAEKIEEQLSQLASQGEARSAAHFSLERTRLEKRLGQARQSIDARRVEIPAFITGNIRKLEQSISAAQSNHTFVQQNKESLERNLEDAEACLRMWTFDTVAEQGKSVDEWERELRSRGYDEDALVNQFPRAFTVIEILHNRRMLGTRDTSTPSADHVYDLAAVRGLLLDAFNPESLHAFLYYQERFRPIIKSFGPGHGFAEMVDRVIQYCHERLMLEELLRAVETDNRPQYQRWIPHLKAEAADD